MDKHPVAIFGEVLFDEFPDGVQVLGGAPFNVAWHTQALGLQPCFISRVSDDAKGAAIRAAMQDWGMALDGLQTDDVHPTGTVQITLDNGEPAYEILAGQAYDFISAGALPAFTPGVFYHGTLALRNPVSGHALQTLCDGHTGKVFVDVNLRAPWWQEDKVKAWIKRADWLKVNDEEFIQLQAVDVDLPQAMREFLQCYGLEVLIVTRGSLGAMAVNKTGEFVEVKPEAELHVVDTVGAGDGFAAVVLLGMQQGWPLQVTMERAQAFAAALVTRRGAVVQDRDFYTPFRQAFGFDHEN